MHPQQYPRRSSVRDKASGGMLSSPIPFALALLGTGSVIFCLWYFFYASGSKPTNEPIPIIKADANPIKVRPDSSEQPEVPHQDKLVYSRVNPAEKASGVEKLLPATEEPIEVAEVEVPKEMADENNKDAGFPTPHELASNTSEFRVEPSEQEKTEAPMTLTTAQEVVEKKPALVETQKPEENPQTLKKVDTTPAVETPATPTKKTTTPALQSGFRIQLASMKSQDMAKQEWTRLQAENSTILKGLPAKFSRVDLGAKKGVFYRLHVGDFADRTQAQNVCNQFLAKNPKAGCIIVKF